HGDVLGVWGRSGADATVRPPRSAHPLRQDEARGRSVPPRRLQQGHQGSAVRVARAARPLASRKLSAYPGPIRSPGRECMTSPRTVRRRRSDVLLRKLGGVAVLGVLLVGCESAIPVVAADELRPADGANAVLPWAFVLNDP